MTTSNNKIYDINLNKFNDLMIGRFIFGSAYDMYGGSKGLYDLGPVGCSIKNNIISYWRQVFVTGENLLEIDTNILTPEAVFKSSGHTERFSDIMVKSIPPSEKEEIQAYRLDHLIEDDLKNNNNKEIDISEVGSWSIEQMSEYLIVNNLKEPETGYELSDPYEFNLMFDTILGPSTGYKRDDKKAYMRPETAQGIFCNFPRLLNFNSGKLPFGGSTVGRAFRNEINPKQGLLRVREFELAEIEYFFDPKQDKHVRFKEVSDTNIKLIPAVSTENSKCLTINLKQALEQKIIKSQILGYFLIRIQEFLYNIGIKPEYLRFRQHHDGEMAHYASDCWDAEILTSYGWIEAVGCSNRSSYDLEQHQNATNTKLEVYISYDKPKYKITNIIVPNKKIIGQKYKGSAKNIFNYLGDNNKSDNMVVDNCIKIDLNNKEYKLKLDEDFYIKQEKHKISGKYIKPHVIEPSFGIGRILYCVLEHNFWVRPEDPNRRVLSLKPQIAPYLCIIIPLYSKVNMIMESQNIFKLLSGKGIRCKIDMAGQSIGKRYSRNDELGIPYAITVDHQTLEDSTVTIRQRDDTTQIRKDINDLVDYFSHI